MPTDDRVFASAGLDFPPMQGNLDPTGQTAPIPLDYAPPSKTSFQKASKWLAAFVLLMLFVAIAWFLFTDPRGYQIRHHPEASLHHAHLHLHQFIREHRYTAPLVYLAVYIIFAVLALPIWWLQFLAGVTFGLYEGTFLSVIGSTTAVTIASAFVRWVAADWFHNRVESHAERLKKLDETLGHNGFLFVMTARLIPLIPFGLFNYALGLSKISLRDIILGTLLGAIPLVTIHVAIGAGYNPHDWIFDLSISALTLVLLTPLLLRYLKPSWFCKIGVE